LLIKNRNLKKSIVQGQVFGILKKSVKL